MIKVLYLPLGNQKSTCDAFVEAGVDLKVFDYLTIGNNVSAKSKVAEIFLQMVTEFQPDLIHMQIQFTGMMDPHTLDQARKICPKVIITNWTGDCRANPDGSFINLSKGCDYSLISSTGQIELYENAGAKNIKYWQIGFDPTINFPKNNFDFIYDVSFIGNHYGQFPASYLRFDTCVKLYQKFGNRFGNFGNHSTVPCKSVPIEKVNDVYNQSICALSISNFNDVAHYFSDRLLYCIASGRPTISWRFPGWEDYFVNGKDIFIVNSFEEIVEVVEYCKNNPDKANEVGKNGWLKASREHTFLSRVSELLSLTGLQ